MMFIFLHYMQNKMMQVSFVTCCCVFSKPMSYEVTNDEIGHVSRFTDCVGRLYRSCAIPLSTLQCWAGSRQLTLSSRQAAKPSRHDRFRRGDRSTYEHVQLTASTQNCASILYSWHTNNMTSCCDRTGNQCVFTAADFRQNLTISH